MIHCDSLITTGIIGLALQGRDKSGSKRVLHGISLAHYPESRHDLKYIDTFSMLLRVLWTFFRLVISNYTHQTPLLGV